MKSVPHLHHRSGQAMLIAVLSLGGAILGATAVAGVLTLYQIRASTDSQNSAKALFAADSGVEWTLFSYYCGTIDSPARCAGATPLPGSPAGRFSGSGATVESTCYDASGNVSDCTDVNNTVSAITLGASGEAHRAFSLTLYGSTTTLP